MTTFGKQGGTGRRACIAVTLGVLLAVGGIACLIAGIVMIRKSTNSEAGNSNKDCKSAPDICAYSKQADSSGLAAFLGKVRETYYEVKPFMITSKPGVTLAEVKEKFKAYDPSPTNLKYVNDKAMQLLNEVKQLEIDRKALKPREKKALSQVKHFLQHVFGRPYDAFYYGGDFMLGPNLFCWQEICNVAKQVQTVGALFKPAMMNDMDIVRDKLMMFNHTFTTYMENLKYGVNAGMVRSKEQCEAGYKSFSRRYPKVASGGANGILKEEYTKNFVNSSEFLSDMKDKVKKQWKDKTGKDAEQSVKEYLVKYVGRPIHTLLSYLQTEYLSHCVPSSVSSGLATLPLQQVYNDTQPVANSSTTGRLPSGEKLDGRKAYEYTLSYFTTTKITPDEVYKLGIEMKDKLWRQIVDVAFQVANSSGSGEGYNKTTALAYLRSKLNASEAFFGNSFPESESNATAHARCIDEKGASLHCPVRWEAMQKWFKAAREVMSMLDPKTIDLFHFTGDMRITPSCPVEMRANFNPAMGAQSYARSNSRCSTSCFYNIPFFLERTGTRYSEWSVNAHEAIPGHHTQVQGSVEYFQDTCGGAIGWLDSVTSYTAFIEGWGLYAENPLIGEDTDTYVGKPLYKYGMLKSQMWRALRLIVDTGLHYKNFTRDDALQYFADYAWDTSDKAEKEITRYQSDPGQATSYMVGQLRLMQIRNYVKNELKSKFNLKDFHYYLLAQGSSPLSYLEESMKEYVRCVQHPDEGCYYVLNPVAKRTKDTDQELAGLDEISAQFLDEYPLEDYF